MTCVLYRHYAADDTLLYAGISITALYRLHQHKKASDWFHLISKITLEHFDSREEALAAEKAAIQKECPKHNIHWWVSSRQKPEKEPALCIDCGALLYRKRRRCVPCTAKFRPEYNRIWLKAHPEKRVEYFHKYRGRYKHPTTETPENRRARYLRDRERKAKANTATP